MAENGDQTANSKVQTILMIGSSIAVSVGVAVWLLSTHANFIHRGAVGREEFLQYMAYRDSLRATLMESIQRLEAKIDRLEKRKCE